MNHTPGPWAYKYDTENGDGIPCYMVASINREVALYLNEFDARLIAAAPDLLDALRTYEAARIRRVTRADGSTTLEMDFPTADAAQHAADAARAALTKSGAFK